MTASHTRKKANIMLRTIFSDNPKSIAFQRIVLDGIGRSLGKTPKQARARRGRIGGVKAEFIEG